MLALLWLAVYAVGTLAMTVYWTLAGATFDARQAKRLFPLLTGAAIVGSFVGTLGAGPLAALLGVENLVLLEAGLLGVAAAVVGRVPTRRRAAQSPAGRRSSVVEQVRVGFDFVRRSPLMSLVAAVYVLLSILMFSVSYPFLLAASAAFDDEVILASVLGALSAGVTATSLLVSVVVAPRIYARFGVTAGALLLPVVYLAGFSLWLVHFSFATAALVRFAQQVTQRGVSNAAWSSLYNTVPGDRRAQVLAFIDGVPGQIGTILSGLLLLATARFLAPDQVLWLGVGTATRGDGRGPRDPASVCGQPARRPALRGGRTGTRGRPRCRSLAARSVGRAGAARGRHGAGTGRPRDGDLPARTARHAGRPDCPDRRDG